MALKTAVCPKCGTAYQYEDWMLFPPKCPTCYAIEEQRKTLERLERVEEERARAERERLERLEELERQRLEELRRIEEEKAYQAWAVLEEQRRIAAEGWKLQAQSMVERANELVNAGLYAEAASLYQRAIAQDPRNIEAYQGLACAFLRLDQSENAREIILKHLRLLQFAKSDATIQATIALILAVQPNADLWEEFLRTSAQYLQDPVGIVYWLIGKGETEKGFALYKLSVDRVFPQHPQAALKEVEVLTHFSQSDCTRSEVYSLWETFAGKAAHWAFEPSEVLYELLVKAPREITTLVLERVQSNIRSLLGYAVAIEMFPRHADAILRPYLSGKEAGQRKVVIDAFVDLKERWKLNVQTIDVIRRALLDWYKAKQPQIKSEFRRFAWQNAERNPTLGCIVGLASSGFFCCLWMYGWYLVDTYTSNEPDYLKFSFYGILIVSLLSLIVGLIASWFPKYLKAEKTLRELHQHEREQLAHLLE